MLSSEIEILKRVMEGGKTRKELAQGIGKSASWVSKLLKNLEERNLIQRNRKVFLQNTHEAKLLSSLSEEFSLQKLLKGKREAILRKLLEPKSTSELENLGFSKTTVYSCFRDLKEIGAVKREGEKYVINEKVKEYVKLSQKRSPFVTLFYSNQEEVGKKSRGEIETPTAFSAFHRYGVDYYPKDNYFYSGEKELRIEDVLVHSLLSVENKKQMSMICIFYLKNRRKINNRDVRKKAERYGCLDKWIDVLRYLDGREVKNKSFFLPWGEFLEKAENYQVKLPEKYSKINLLKHFQTLGKNLEEEITIYLIGGANLILRDLKDSTKDFDIILEGREDFNSVVNKLKELGFSEKIKLEKAYQNLNPSIVLRKEGFPTWDIFVRKVCNALILTSGMKERSEFYKSFNNLEVNLVSLNDIFLFKSITDREGDLEDAALLARKGKVDWNAVLKEIKNQEKISKTYFSFALLDTLDVLKEEYGMEVPILKKLVSYCLENALLLTLKEPKNIRDLREELDFPEHKIYNKLKKLEEEGKIKVNRKGKLNKYRKN